MNNEATPSEPYRPEIDPRQMTKVELIIQLAKLVGGLIIAIELWMIYKK